jgi:predicted NACHT family NTPase
MSSLGKLPAQQSKDSSQESSRIDALEVQISNVSSEFKDLRTFIEESFARLNTGAKQATTAGPALSSTSRSHQLLRELKAGQSGKGASSIPPLSTLAELADDRLAAVGEPVDGETVELSHLAQYLTDKQSPLSRRFASASISLVLAKHGSFVTMAKQNCLPN